MRPRRGHVGHEHPIKYTYLFRSSKGTQVRVLRGDGPPKIVGGSGGWDVVSRPRRVAMTQWVGRDPYRMDVPIIFDGWRQKVSVEEDIRRLNAMSVGSDWNAPPTITLQGALPVNGATWVIEDIDWGDEVFWAQGAQGRYYRQRQDAVVHLLQYQAEERLKVVMPRDLPQQYTVFNKKGETLRNIAKAVYGSAKRWKEIQKANPGKVRDPNKIPYKTTLRIP